jgi:hypothetical protein
MLSSGTLEEPRLLGFMASLSLVPGRLQGVCSLFLATALEAQSRVAGVWACGACSWVLGYGEWGFVPSRWPSLSPWMRVVPQVRADKDGCMRGVQPSSFTPALMGGRAAGLRWVLPHVETCL